MQTYRFFLQLTKDIDNYGGLTGKTVSGYGLVINNYYHLLTPF
jgi:hypothetical protein